MKVSFRPGVFTKCSLTDMICNVMPEVAKSNLAFYRTDVKI